MPGIFDDMLAKIGEAKPEGTPPAGGGQPAAGGNPAAGGQGGEGPKNMFPRSDAWKQEFGDR